MKEIGIVTLLSVLAVAAAPHARSEREAVFVTKKSTRTLSDCLAAAHVSSAARIAINDRGSRREIQLRDAPLDGPRAQAVKQCL